MLTFIKEVEKTGTERRALYLCHCGTEKVITIRGAKKSRTQSCGCLVSEAISKAVSTHGMRQIREYRVWQAMRERCENSNNKSYDRYGGRGISVCDRWQKFENFISDMGLSPTPKHQIDRIDNSAGYYPENCRWVTIIENARNKRSNVLLTWEGRTMCRAEWAEELGICPRLVQSRVAQQGWSEAEALELIPRQKTGNRFTSRLNKTKAQESLG